MTKPLEGEHVAVLLGGISPEREVSLISGAACADALERLGAKVTRVDAGRDLAAVLTSLKPDVCFNALHGAWGAAAAGGTGAASALKSMSELAAT